MQNKSLQNIVVHFYNYKSMNNITATGQNIQLQRENDQFVCLRNAHTYSLSFTFFSVTGIIRRVGK